MLRTQEATHHFVMSGKNNLPEIKAASISVQSAKHGNSKNFRVYPYSGFNGKSRNETMKIFHDMGVQLGGRDFLTIDMGPMDKGHNFVLAKLKIDCADPMRGSTRLRLCHESGAMAKILPSNTDEP